jgi:hypothetical protein
MARAYAYAEGDGPEPRELAQLKAINRFGAEAVMGRPLGVGEIRRMTTAEAIVGGYQQRARAESWASWASAHPESSALLILAMRAAGIDESGG